MSRLPVASHTTTAVTSTTVARRRTRRRLGALCVWACLVWTLPAAAVEVIAVGAAGSAGLNGATPGAAGTDGGAGAAVVRDIFSADADNLLLVTGGDGGQGGYGARDVVGRIGGPPGNSGAGGLAAATLSVTTSAAPVDFRLAAAGGNGAQAGHTRDWRPYNNKATAGAGGDGRAHGVLNTSGADPVRGSVSASAGNGGEARFGSAGKGGNATAQLDVNLGGSRNAVIAATATAGAGGSAQLGATDFGGGAGNGGKATSKVTVTATPPVSNAWDAVLDVRSTAQGGGVRNEGIDRPVGGAADATVTLSGYGRSTGVAVARGADGYFFDEETRARAVVSSGYSATARAEAQGGMPLLNGPGGGAHAYAQATGGYHAHADAVGRSGGYGWLSNTSASAEAVANVHRLNGVPQPSAPDVPAEARAHALSTSWGGGALASSSYRDDVRNAAVSSKVNIASSVYHDPEASSAVNVGGAAYGAWQYDPGHPGHVVAYASVLPERASLTPSLASAPQVRGALDNATVLGAGVIGGAGQIFAAESRYTLPFAGGQHLLLGLFNPSEQASGVDSLAFSFSVSQGDTVLYSVSGNSFWLFNQTFGDRVIDLGAIQDDTLDLLVQFTLNEGSAGFNYVLGSAAMNRVAVVPEPSTWLLLMLGLTILGWRAGKLRRAD